MCGVGLRWTCRTLVVASKPGASFSLLSSLLLKHMVMIGVILAVVVATSVLIFLLGMTLVLILMLMLVMQVFRVSLR